MKPTVVGVSEKLTTFERLGQWNQHYFVDKVDPRIKPYPFFGSILAPPWGVFGIVALYVYFIKVLGPRIMEKRKPYHLRGVMIAYNAVQVVLSAYTFYEAWVAGWGGRYNWMCQPLGPNDYSPMDIRAARCAYLYFCCKIVDLLDTGFIILRKNYRQLSFLHTYHHAVMVLGVWYGIAYAPGGHITFVGFLNTFVHTIMYAYYLLTAIDPSYKANITAKKWITRMQLAQFVGVFVHSAQVFLQPSCEVPRFNMLFLMVQSIIMIVLFSNFYYQCYVKRRKTA